MWTTICTSANAMQMPAVIRASAITPLITSPNGMAVRITDRTKPIT